MMIQIKKIKGELIHEGDYNALKNAVEFCVAHQIDLQGADLHYANLQDADLQGAHLHYANLQGADLQGARMHYANLQDADLQGADLQGARMHYADLQGAHLHYANLHYADLQGAHLHYADLQGAHLHYANLQGARMHYADLQGAHLHYANLQGADLQGAHLQGADLQYANLQDTKYSILSILKSNFYSLSDELTLELMRWDCISCGEEKMKIWVDTYACPFADSEREFYFKEKKELWVPGKPTMNYKELFIALCKEKEIKI